jgi:hypothetical protein
MQRFSGEIPQLLLEEIFKYREEKGLADAQLPIQVLLRYYGFFRATELDVPALVRMITMDLSSKNQEHRETALYFALFLLRVRFDREVLVGLLHALAKTVQWPNRAGTASGMSMTKYSYSRQNIGEYVFVRFARIAAEMARDGHPIVSFDYSRAFEEVRDKRSPKIVLSASSFEKLTDPAPPARLEFTEIFEGINIKDQKAARDVLTVGVT